MVFFNVVRQHSITAMIAALLLLVQDRTFAAYALPDSVIHPGKPFKIKEQQFLNTYGTDDSSRALIRYYYPERKTSISNTVFSSGLLIAAATLFLISNGALMNGMGFFLLLTLAGAGYGGGLLLVVGQASLLALSRRRLFKLLQAYHSGKGIPKHIRRATTFRRLVKQEQQLK